jgi:UDP-N-acetyl-D-glucosamine dehydrogenase
MELLNKINNNNAKIAVVGLGYVGLPLSFAFLKNGFNVIGLDTDQNKIDSLLQGKSYFKHIKIQELPEFIDNKKFIPSNNFNHIKNADVIIICVPTPLNKFREPDLNPILSSASMIKDYLKKDQLVILESSTYPGTTDEVLTKELEKSGLNANEDFYIAYSPEREDPGNKSFNTSTIPKIVGADTPESRKLTENLYKKVISGGVVAVSSSRTAEATKLTENIFRSVNIALVNELKTIYDVMGIDIWEVVNAAATKPFGYMPFYPGPGLGGHCIPIDPFYLTHKAREFNVPTKFIELAGEINTSMPQFVLDKIVVGLSDNLAKAINGSKVLIIGMSYKNDIDDLRESPALTMLELLTKNKAIVSYHDSFIPEIPLTREYSQFKGIKSCMLNTNTIEANDAVVIITKHSDVDYALIGKHANLIIDTRNAMDGINSNCEVIKA